jgi:hypothetical protein
MEDIFDKQIGKLKLQSRIIRTGLYPGSKKMAIAGFDGTQSELGNNLFLSKFINP